MGCTQLKIPKPREPRAAQASSKLKSKVRGGLDGSISNIFHADGNSNLFSF